MYQIYAVELHVTKAVNDMTLPSNDQAVRTLNHQKIEKRCTTQASVIFRFTYFKEMWAGPGSMALLLILCIFTYLYRL
jgi:hypothetical protein